MKPRLAVSIGVVLVLAGCTAHIRSQVDEARIKFTPNAATHWQIQLTGAFDTAVTANVYDLDPYTTDQATVSDIVADRHRAICHLDVGASDTTLPDANRFPADILGAPDGTDRRWLDIRQWNAIEPVLASRFELCRAKGFQAVDADETYGYANPSGFDLTSADQITYDRRVADLAHADGLAVGIRTLPATIHQVVPLVDFDVVDGCFTTPDCSDYFAFIEAGKAVYDVETGPSADFCTMAHVYGFAAIRKPDDVLDGRVQDC